MNVSIQRGIGFADGEFATHPQVDNEPHASVGVDLDSLSSAAHADDSSFVEEVRKWSRISVKDIGSSNDNLGYGPSLDAVGQLPGDHLDLWQLRHKSTASFPSLVSHRRDCGAPPPWQQCTSCLRIGRGSF